MDEVWLKVARLEELLVYLLLDFIKVSIVDKNLITEILEKYKQYALCHRTIQDSRGSWIVVRDYV